MKIKIISWKVLIQKILSWILLFLVVTESLPISLAYLCIFIAFFIGIPVWNEEGIEISFGKKKVNPPPHLHDDERVQMV